MSANDQQQKLEGQQDQSHAHVGATANRRVMKVKDILACTSSGHMQLTTIVLLQTNARLGMYT